jgi:REP element-mobilizing transposase RayT
MSNHIHLIWQMQPLIHPQHVQRDFLKYTAQQIKADLQKNHPAVLSHFESARAGICKLPEEYKYSSALFYESGFDNWGFLAHYHD